MEETLEVLSAFMEVALTGPRDRVTIRWQPNSSSPLPGVAWWGGGCLHPAPPSGLSRNKWGRPHGTPHSGKSEGLGAPTQDAPLAPSD